MTTVFIDGAAGTTGLEIRERLEGRAGLTLAVLPEDKRKDATARAEALNDADVVILCLPDDAAREAVSLLRNDRTRVIDASTAFRTDAVWTYGFPELTGREAVATAKRVSNPGCYPTGFLGLVAPLVRAGLVPAELPLSVNAVSGYSGGGKSMIADYESGDEESAFRAYALGLGHKHVPEMQAHAGLAHPPIFTPAVAHSYRGMLVEVPLHLHLLPKRPTLADLRATLADFYAGSALVRVADEAPALLRVEHNAGTDRLDLFVLGDEAAGQARLIAALDNLGKGAAGAAVQSLNLMAGLTESAGLRL